VLTSPSSPHPSQIGSVAGRVPYHPASDLDLLWLSIGKIFMAEQDQRSSRRRIAWSVRYYKHQGLFMQRLFSAAALGVTLLPAPPSADHARQVSGAAGGGLSCVTEVDMLTATGTIFRLAPTGELPAPPASHVRGGQRTIAAGRSVGF